MAVNRAGIVLGLYIAALLLAGPLHPLMHENSKAGAQEGCTASITEYSFHDNHVAEFTLHPCPACFFNSHQVLATDQESAELVSDFSSSETVTISIDLHSLFAGSLFSNRAPPISL